MKSLHCSSVLKTALLIVPLALCFGGSTVGKAGDSDPLSISAVRPGTLDNRTESAQGYLKVYSATDEFNDSGLAYYSTALTQSTRLTESSLKTWKITFRGVTKVPS
jgi:hypothetical protein